MTERGFIKFDLILLSLFSALMAFLFYAGVDSISFSNNDIRSLLNETPSKQAKVVQEEPQDDPSIDERLESPAKLLIIPNATVPVTNSANHKTAQQQLITGLQNQVLQLTLQLQQIEPAAAQDTPNGECERQSQADETRIPAMVKMTAQTEQNTVVVAPPLIKQAAQSAPAVKPAPNKTPNPASTQQQPLHNKDWLLSQKDTLYSMQILAVRSKQELKQEIKKSNLGIETLAYYPTIRNGHVWYALLYGLFESQAEAQHALKKLPAAIRQNKPWLRSLRAIKKTIQQVPIETK